MKKVNLIKIRNGTRKVITIEASNSSNLQKNGRRDPLVFTCEADGPIHINEASSRTYLELKTKEVQAWEKLHTHLCRAAVESHAAYSTTCFICSNEEAPYRCSDCSPLPLCYDCVARSHILQPLHCIEIWKEPGIYCPFNFPGLRVLTSPDVLLGKGSVNKEFMTLIDEKGRTHQGCCIIYQSQEDDQLALTSALVKLGFWPLSPFPNTAVSTKLLSLLQCLMLECQVSAQGFVATIEKYIGNEWKKRSELKKVLRGECLHEYRLLWQKLDRVPLSLLLEHKQWLNSCPACPKDSGTKVISLDGNFGLVRKSNSGHTFQDSSDIHDLYFLDQRKVDDFVDGYFQDTKDSTEECSQFQAGDIVRSKNKTLNLSVTGVFGSACRHEVPCVFLDLRHGERLAYPVFMIEYIKETFPDVQLQVLYDIACVLKGHLKKRKKLELLDYIELAIPVFHSYGHRADCQVTLNPRRMSGFGLTDGEQLERLWSYLRLFSKITKEQTCVHRRTLLTIALLHYAQKKFDSLEDYLEEKWEKADSIVKTAKASLDEASKLLKTFVPVEEMSEFVQSLKDDQKEAFKRKRLNAEKAPGASWKEVYMKELILYRTFQGQLYSGLVTQEEDVLKLCDQINASNAKLLGHEKKHKIKRWTPESAELQEQQATIHSRRCTTVLLKLNNLAAEMHFHKEKRKEYCDGQSQAARIAIPMKSLSQTIRNTVKTYNVAVGVPPPDSPHPFTVRAEDVYTGSPIFDSLDPQIHPRIPQSLCKKTIEAWDMRERAKEEKLTLVEDMKRTYTHFGLLHFTLQEVLLQYPGEDLYELGVYSLTLKNLQILHGRVKRMYTRFSVHADLAPPPELAVTTDYQDADKDAETNKPGMNEPTEPAIGADEEQAEDEHMCQDPPVPATIDIEHTF